MVPIPEIKPETEQPVGDSVDGPATKKAKILCLLGMLALVVVVGVLEQITPDTRDVDQLLTIGTAVIEIILINVWCQYDSWERSYTIGKPLRLLIIFFAAIGVPVYLLRTRGWRGLVSIVLVAVFAGLLMLAEELAVEVTYRLLD